MLMEISMTDIGRMIRHMDMESIVTWMEQDMKGTGKKINSTEKAWKHGLMAHLTKEITLKVRNMALGASLGLMEALIQGNSMKTILKEEVSTSGPMAVSMMVSGRTIKWRATECSPGPITENTKENI